MKNILKLSLIGLIFLMVGACENTDLEELLDNPNSVTPENAELDLVFNNIMLEFEDFIDESSDETMPYTRMMAMTGGNQYNNQDSPTSFDILWGIAYADLVPDIDLVIALSEDLGATAHSGIAKVVKAYVFMTLVDLFGNVPFSEANKGVEFQNPAADDDEAVYAAALAMLDDAISDLGKPAPHPVNDLFYGDLSASAARANWIKAANSLKIRANVITKQAGGSASAINDIVTSGNYIQANSEDLHFNYGTTRSAPDSRHPYFADSYDGDAASVYLSNYYMWMLIGDKVTPDPRLRYYFYRQDCDETDEDLFTLDCTGQLPPSHWSQSESFFVPQNGPWCTASLNEAGFTGYWGRDHGNNDGIPPDDEKRTVYGVYPAGGKFDNDACSTANNSGTDGGKGAGVAPVILASYVDFYLAEAALTMGANGNPTALLESGIRKSIAKAMSFGSLDSPGAFEPTQTEIDAYVTEVVDAFNAAGADDKLNILMKEFHIALWGQGVDAYNNYRRTAKPANMQPTRGDDPGDFPRLLWYPADYVNLNSKASQRAITEQVFWDKLPAGAIK